MLQNSVIKLAVDLAMLITIWLNAIMIPLLICYDLDDYYQKNVKYPTLVILILQMIVSCITAYYEKGQVSFCCSHIFFCLLDAILTNLWGFGPLLPHSLNPQEESCSILFFLLFFFFLLLFLLSRAQNKIEQSIYRITLADWLLVRRL